ncbi:unnamed protein product, partial [Polarella glacialis]
DEVFYIEDPASKRGGATRWSTNVAKSLRQQAWAVLQKRSRAASQALRAGNSEAAAAAWARRLAGQASAFATGPSSSVRGASPEASAFATGPAMVSSSVGGASPEALASYGLTTTARWPQLEAWPDSKKRPLPQPPTHVKVSRYRGLETVVQHYQVAASLLVSPVAPKPPPPPRPPPPTPLPPPAKRPRFEARYVPARFGSAAVGPKARPQFPRAVPQGGTVGVTVLTVPPLLKAMPKARPVAATGRPGRWAPATVKGRFLRVISV